ncbi:hypothetical protein K437DRAFT_7973 [Tilletiaria anomala UBC 951]|uniref:Uncharacterized protein n=1 Tax=Tilletiaria anomala (strain ATCC 24038 / CBS 436.72 / UBC 951) TaxID=1037660 RepID=A0A066VDC2_TILAU|nr:uncharacterized protein K437DRAFT_7973 [Tilletiaria anomala UBC 951]KDN39742.1 hypothetical protein K437DRAFT_7973 [Tilletiaria anomala UBC 951]
MLSRRTRGPRKGTGRPHLRTKGELIAEGLTDRSAALMGFLGPFCIGLGEPIVLDINLHIGLVYEHIRSSSCFLRHLRLRQHVLYEYSKSY